MASAGKNKSKRGKSASKKFSTGIIMLVVMGVVLVGALIAGMSSVFHVSSPAPEEAAASNAGLGGLAVTDRTTEFLGASTDAAALARAETGATGHPTLVMFHADW